MAKLLYVTASGAPLATAGIRGLTVNNEKALFRSTGDNTEANYKGRGEPKGTVIFEDFATALGRIGQSVTASQTFSVKNDAGATTTVTITDFMVTRLNGRVDEGLGDGDVVGWSCDWVGATIS